MWTPLYYLLIPFFLQAQAILVNVTVDDSGINPLTGQPIIYNPPGVWNLGANCTACTAKIDNRDMQNGTWHDSTFDPPLPMSSQTESQLPTASLVFNDALKLITIYVHRYDNGKGSSNRIPLIVGLTIGVFVFLALITAFVVFVSRRSRQMNTLQFSDGRTRPFIPVYANSQGATSSSQIPSLSTLGFSANPSFAAFNGHGASLGSSASQTTASRERPPALSIFIPSSTPSYTPMMNAPPPAYYVANDPDSIPGGDVGDTKYARAP
ncbi:hypothetical protein BDQ12DRAFT_764476 [Crucibulum laeve]|uniref:Uncharacterized protein n=1 Tax=Crucibulum laeve TaxID=68775 RepID=A0A5C3LNA2_9AGAR|nr:hypothetical protein BDQ12DRAFT_764476 [Crucibulum laeve]